MNPDTLAEAILAVVTPIAADLRPDETPDIGIGDVVLERPRNRDHGDWASNVAMRLAKRLGTNPRELAQRIADEIASAEGVASAEVAGPGFINFRLDAAAAGVLAKTIVDAGDAYGTNDSQQGVSVNVEFVSANPTGPLHIGHTRWAALGDSLVRLLRAAGELLDAEGVAAEALAEPATHGSPLSERELEVARLTAQGLSNARIAERLVISRRTVETHQDHNRAKLHLASRFEVIAWAMAQEHLRPT